MASVTHTTADGVLWHIWKLDQSLGCLPLVIQYEQRERERDLPVLIKDYDAATTAASRRQCRPSAHHQLLSARLFVVALIVAVVTVKTCATTKAVSFFFLSLSLAFPLHNFSFPREKSKSHFIPSFFSAHDQKNRNVCSARVMKVFNERRNLFCIHAIRNKQHGRRRHEETMVFFFPYLSDSRFFTRSQPVEEPRRRWRRTPSKQSAKVGPKMVSLLPMSRWSGRNGRFRPSIRRRSMPLPALRWR